MVKILKHALINALGSSLYVILIASFLYFLGNGFLGNNQTIFIPIALLLLFVFSAAFTGILMFGKPVIWYLDNKKRESISLLLCTLSIFFVITLIAFFLLALFFV